MPLSSPNRSALADQVITSLRAQITSGEWPVGSRIPTEPELVERLGVARNTVREAVRALAHNGLLDIRQGSGTYVVATSELAGVMHRRFAGADPRHVAELRSTLEAAGARLAAGRRTDQEMAQLDTLLERREAAWDSRVVEDFVEADANLHLAVVAASGNDVLTALYADLGHVLRAFLRGDVGERLRPEDHVDHARMIEAIRSRDAEAAAREAGSYTQERQCRVPHGTGAAPALPPTARRNRDTAGAPAPADGGRDAATAPQGVPADPGQTGQAGQARQTGRGPEAGPGEQRGTADAVPS